MYWNYDTNYVVSLLGYGSGQWSGLAMNAAENSTIKRSY